MDFLGWCYERYIEGNFPSECSFRKTEEFKRVVVYAKELVENSGLDSFYSFAQESQYLVNLWTAHIILEYFEPNDRTKSACLEIVERYANGRLNKKIASQEKKWLVNYHQ